jgi:hypothetical protein
MSKLLSKLVFRLTMFLFNIDIFLLELCNLGSVLILIGVHLALQLGHPLPQLFLL